MAEQATRSKQDTATLIIARQLGMRPQDVTNETDLGDRWGDILTVVCFETGAEVGGTDGMKAGDIYRQLL